MYTSTKVKIQNALLVIFHYGLDNGLLIELHLKLIIKSNCWLLKVDKRKITQTF